MLEELAQELDIKVTITVDLEEKKVKSYFLNEKLNIFYQPIHFQFDDYLKKSVDGKQRIPISVKHKDCKPHTVIYFENHNNVYFIRKKDF